MDLDDAKLEALRHELIVVRRWAVDRDGAFLVWAGGRPAAGAPMPSITLSPITPTRTRDRTETELHSGEPASTTAAGHLEERPF